MKSNFLITNPQNLDDIMGDQENPTPSLSTTAFKSFEGNFFATQQGLNKFSNIYLHTDPDLFSNDLDNVMSGVDDVLNNPGIQGAQKAADYVSGIIGFGLNPINAVTAIAGGETLGVAAKAASKLLPEEAAAFLNKPVSSVLGKAAPVAEAAEEVGSGVEPQAVESFIPKTIGETGLLATKGAAAAGTSMIPQEVADNYNADTNSINWGGVVKGTAINGGIGFLLPLLPFAVGTAWKKVFGSDSSVPEAGSAPDSAMETDKSVQAINDAEANKQITTAEKQLLQDYLNKPNDDALQKQATDVMAKYGIPFNSATKEIPLNLLNKNDWEALNSAMWDQAASQGEISESNKTNLSDFINNNRMDDIRTNNQKMSDGLQSTIDFMQSKQDAKAAKLADADDILDKSMMRGVNANKDFTQKSIDRILKKANYETSHVENLPLVIPDNLAKRASMQTKIQKLQAKLDPDNPNKQTLRRIQELQNSLPEIQTPKEELTAIKEKLLPKEGLIESFEKTKEYQRLEQLSDVWPQANTLLDRIKLEDQYNKQADYKNVLQSIKNIMDSALPKMADSDSVSNYLKQRIETTQPDYAGEPIREPEAPVRQEHTTETQAATLAEKESEVRSSSASSLKSEFKDANNKLNEFKEKKTVFQNLISCIMG